MKTFKHYISNFLNKELKASLFNFNLFAEVNYVPKPGLLPALNENYLHSNRSFAINTLKKFTSSSQVLTKMGASTRYMSNELVNSPLDGQSFNSINPCTFKSKTQNKISLERYLDVFGNHQDNVLKMAYLNSYYQTDLKNLYDKAILEHAEHTQELNTLDGYHKLNEIPFDNIRRRLSVILQKADEHHVLICKGTLEKMLGVCRYVRIGNMVHRLTPILLERIQKSVKKFNRQGLTVLAIAVREFSKTKSDYTVEDETALTLLGYITFLDQNKDTSAIASHIVQVSAA